MTIFVLGTAKSLHEACAEVASAVLHRDDAPMTHVMWRKEILPCPLDALLTRVRGAERVFFKSRDRDFEFVGFGAADKVCAMHDDDDALSSVVSKASTLLDDQGYFGAMRFDESAPMAKEWMSFGKKFFVLPLVCVIKRDGKFHINVSFRVDGHQDWARFQDNVITLLRSLCTDAPQEVRRLGYASQTYLPSREHYALTIHRALNAFVERSSHKKVVVGRRNCFSMPTMSDPSHLFCALRAQSRDAFLFFLDSGTGGAFLGVSPELLYRRSGRYLETESLAGTRPRACDETKDDNLRSELLKSIKDNQEHALVSLHIEQKLKDFGTTDVAASKLEIMALAFVQHLLRRYHGIIGDAVDDAMILPSLHPTPAVCGLEIEWAREFIRTYEGFDRGFYAGPIGYIAKDHAEFAVAIRSALFDRQRLFVYAACGIVPGSLHNQEWEELNNKEKSIVSIFDREH